MKGLQCLAGFVIIGASLNAQDIIRFEPDPANARRVSIKADQNPFAQFWYDDTLRKPYLHQVYAPGGHLVTRGYPLMTRPEDTTDHPHQAGIWLTYEDVNGTDFWNNSVQAPPAKQAQVGAIMVDSIVTMQPGNPATLAYTGRWKDKQKQNILKETTEIRFSTSNNSRIIDRTTTLTALVPAHFGDVKDGLFGIRVCRELQMPWPGDPSAASGNYLASTGLTGHEVWGKPAAWMLLYGKMSQDTVSLLIADHPKNPGYPARWHARGYGLFSINPLANKAFDPSQPPTSMDLRVGQSVTFKYRLVISTGSKVMDEKVD